MRSLVLMEQGFTLSVDGELFEIRRGETAIEKLRMAEVSEVLVFGSVALTPACVSTLLSRGIDTVFLTARGRYRGRLVGPANRNVELRVAQYTRWLEEGFRDSVARAVVRGKLSNQRSLVLRAQRELKSGRLAATAASMRRLLPELDKPIGADSHTKTGPGASRPGARRARNPATVRGCEKRRCFPQNAAAHRRGKRAPRLACTRTR